MTDREKAIVMAYTGTCMLTGEKFQIFQKYIEDIMERPVMTHELGFLANTIKEKSKDDFISLCTNESDCENVWYDISSDEMTLEQARQAVKDLRKILAELFHVKHGKENDDKTR